MTTQHRDYFSEFAKALSIFDLARFARVNKMAAECARREMIARIGQRNYDLVSAARECSVAELKYFYRAVRDAAAYIPLVIALRRRYFPRNFNEYRDIDYITCHFIHVGLINCARLIRVNKNQDILTYRDSCPAANNQEWCCEMQARQEHTMNHFCSGIKREPRHVIPAPDELLWYSLEYMPSYSDELIVLAALDQLDVRCFGLLVEIIGAATYKLKKSNDNWPRWQQHFVRQCLGRFVQPKLTDSTHQQATNGSVLEIFARDVTADLTIEADTAPTPQDNATVDIYIPCPMCSVAQK